MSALPCTNSTATKKYYDENYGHGKKNLIAKINMHAIAQQFQIIVHYYMCKNDKRQNANY